MWKGRGRVEGSRRKRRSVGALELVAVAQACNSGYYYRRLGIKKGQIELHINFKTNLGDLSRSQQVQAC